MLPPVRALSNSDVSYQNQQNPQPGSSAVDAVRLPTPPAVVANPDAAAFARASILSLSGQLQLSQSVTILAETLGKIMNLPRKEGEAVDDYVNRLTQAIRVMSPADRMALEQQLGKTLQGLTLRVLAEIMKNPAGPDAARLAVILEMSRYKERDMAAKAVVSSYRQNNGADPLAGAPARPANPVATPAAANTPAAKQADAGLLVPPSFRPLPATAGNPALSNGAAAAQLAAEEAGQTNTEIVSPANRNVARVAMEGGAASRVAASSVDPDAALQVQEAMAGAEVDRTEQQAAAIRRDGKLPSLFESAAGARTQEFKPAPPLRQPEVFVAKHMAPAGGKAGSNPTQLPGQMPIDPGMLKNIDKLLLAALTANTLPQRGETGLPFLPLTQAPLANLPDPANPSEVAGRAAPAAHNSSADIQPPADRSPYVTGQNPAPVADARVMVTEQPLMQSAAAALVKDAVPLPFLNYPGAKDEADASSPHRGRWPSGGDGGENPPENHDGQQEHEQGADGEEQDAAMDEAGTESALPEPDGGTDVTTETESAHAFYLRMGGLV